MGFLINELLTLAKIDAKQLIVSKEVFDLSELAKEVLQQIEPILVNKKIKINVSINQGLCLYGDANKIRQVLLILLDNAIKYNNEYGEIIFKISQNDKETVIEISDTGMGISDEDKNHIFDRFYRGDKARSREEGSPGLGLSIAQWIIKEHKGRIKVEGELGKGSSFIIEIPK